MPQLKHVISDPDHRGNPRWYYRRKDAAGVWRKLRIRADRSDVEAFHLAWLHIHNRWSTAPEQLPKGGPLHPDALSRLVDKFRRSSTCLLLDETTRRRHLRLLGEVCALVDTGNGHEIGDCPYTQFRRSLVIKLRDLFAERGPSVGNGVVKSLSVLFNTMIRDEVIEGINPTLGVAKLPPEREGGHYTWTADDFAKYRARWPVGSKQRLALEVALYTGVRVSDLARLGPALESKTDADVLEFVETKGGRSRALTHRPKPKRNVCGVPAALRKIIAVTKPTGLKTYLVNASGRPYDVGHLSRRIIAWAKAAGCHPRCRAHGIRKGGATAIAHNGGTASELQGYGNWSSLAEPELYTRAINRAAMMTRAQQLLGSDLSPAKIEAPGLTAISPTPGETIGPLKASKTNGFFGRAKSYKETLK